MKVFSELEKEIINKICETTNGTFLQNYLFNKYQGYNFPYDREKESFGIQINIRPEQMMEQVIYFEERELEIYYLARLLKYLEENDYIIAYQDVDHLLPGGSIATTSPREPAYYELKETKYKTILLKYLGKVIKPTPDLYDLKKHKYRILEVRQLIAKWTGIWIAIAMSTISIIISCIGIYLKCK